MLRHQLRYNQLTFVDIWSTMISKNKPFITKYSGLVVKLSSPKLKNNCDLTVDKIFTKGTKILAKLNSHPNTKFLEQTIIQLKRSN